MSRGEQLKVSEVAGLIDQIEAGGGTSPFTYIEYVDDYSSKYYEGNPLRLIHRGYSESLKVKIKESCSVAFSEGITVTKNESDLKCDSYVNKGDEITVKISALKTVNVICFGDQGEYKEPDPPDIITVLYQYDG